MLVHDSREFRDGLFRGFRGREILRRTYFLVMIGETTPMRPLRKSRTRNHYVRFCPS